MRFSALTPTILFLCAAVHPSQARQHAHKSGRKGCNPSTITTTVTVYYHPTPVYDQSSLATSDSINAAQTKSADNQVPTDTPSLSSTAALGQDNSTSIAWSTPQTTDSNIATPAPEATQSGVDVPIYGSNVDVADASPANKSQPPDTLANRNDNASPDFEVGGKWIPPFTGSIGGDYILMWTNSNVSLTGTGYFQVRWEVAWFNSVGQIRPPTWIGLRGKLFHVASGGGWRMDDTHKDGNGTWMGIEPNQLDTLPEGMQQMWQNEYYYLNGSVTLVNNEGPVDYNLAITPLTWEEVNESINTGPDDWPIRYGISRDTVGDDSAPVPQYVTNSYNNTDVQQVSDITFIPL